MGFFSVSVATELARMKEWDSVVTCHRGHPEARTWNLANGTIGKHSLTSRHVDEGAVPQVRRHLLGNGMRYGVLFSEIRVCLVRLFVFLLVNSAAV